MNHIAIRTGNLIHYHECADSSHIQLYLEMTGFSAKSAAAIAAWAVSAAVDAKYTQNEIPGIEIYIV